jgi:hypothetical protein
VEGKDGMKKSLQPNNELSQKKGKLDGTHAEKLQ